MRKFGLLVITMLLMSLAPPTAPDKTCEWGSRMVALTRVQANMSYREAGDAQALVQEAKAALRISSCSSA